MKAAALMAMAMAHGHGPVEGPPHVEMPGRVFSPQRAVAVAGDAVTWRNTGSEAHNVAGEGFESGRMGAGTTYVRAFEGAGEVRYACTLHAFMYGSVDVVGGVLEGPEEPVARGDSAVLRGRVRAGVPEVVLERVDGAGPSPVRTVPVAPDGRLGASVRPEQTGGYRVVGPDGPSAVARVTVVDRARVALALRRGRRAVVLSALVRPARSGVRVALQLYSPERFSWRRVGSARTARDGRVRFRLSRSVRRRARVVVLDRADSVAATSRTVRTWR